MLFRRLTKDQDKFEVRMGELSRRAKEDDVYGTLGNYRCIAKFNERSSKLIKSVSRNKGSLVLVNISDCNMALYATSIK